MKYIKYIVMVGLTMVLLQACTDDFEEINTNPNAQVVGSNESLLLGAQILAARELLDNINSNNKGAAKWVQYYTNTTAPTDFVASNPREDINDFWVYQNLVTQTIPLIERILDNTEESPQPNYKAVALTLKAWIYGNMTELWGPIPFSDAQFGEISEEERYNKPKFDTQEEILKSVLGLLEEANQTFDLSGEASVALNGESDAYAGGDLLKWKKFANSLQVRILLRISDVDSGFAKPKLETIFGNAQKYPLLEGNEDNFGMTWETTIGSYSDPFAQYIENSANSPIAVTGFVNTLGNLQDPRIKVFLDPAPGYSDSETYTGVPPAFDEENPSGYTRVALDSVSQLSQTYTTAQERFIMTYSELLFIKAEAASKGIETGISAAQAYQDGIKAHMEQLEIDPVMIDTYLTSSDVIFNPSNALEQIITQRYIAQFGQSINTFSMIRRTGLPKLDFFDIGINKEKGYPVRIGYPRETMQNFNQANFEAAIQGVNIVDNVFGDPLWFAKNAPTVKMEPTIQGGPVLFSY
ncbi:MULTISPECIES: SusD/RagB family nutrient-binding outer membrane lipoprotein [Zobellia]|uniref:SusD/RagB family nutrient-binding outer membrane lipoprotein n=1 Tax=Zobellia TaxID=112040 RepID=UPI001BFF8A73|nr:MULTISPECIES: SusD/RagB family nutrient-binding outer membrane lipoprotein [Zobellia]MBT9187589.1 SusD/RagB family nutrient-binding outer membrane lipoprotein [Zobellia russellii]MBU2975555.1 SusD/RagB family nutrient-binding outer membrane lipoprotein [Zobellia sp. B3R18]